jgi:hypothetical protein
MPAQNVQIPPNTWTLVTVNDVTAATFSNFGMQPVYLKGTVGATPPTSSVGAISLLPFDTRTSAETLAELFPGLGAVTRVYAYCEAPAVVSCNHA